MEVVSILSGEKERKTMANYKLWNVLEEAKKYKWVELSHSLNNESPYWSGIPDGSVELAKTVWDWGKPELECLIQTFKFPGQFGTHIDFPGHFIKGENLSEKYFTKSSSLKSVLTFPNDFKMLL